MQSYAEFLDEGREDTLFLSLAKTVAILVKIPVFMDYIVLGVIVAALFSGFRLIKEVHEKKTLKRPLFYVELFLICLIAFFGITGQLSKVFNDAVKISRILAGIKDATSHSDSTARQYDDSNARREKRMEDTIKKYKEKDAAQRKPRIEILPFKEGPNPTVDDSGNGRYQFAIGFQNIGNAAAHGLHAQYDVLLKNAGKWKYIRSSANSAIADLEFLPIPDLVVGTSIGCKVELISNDSLFLIVQFCYEDSLKKCYGPYLRCFDWPYDKLKKQPNLPEEDETDFVKHFFKEQSRLRTSCF